MAGEIERMADFFARSLRVWAERGVDPVHGDFVEALTIEGVPLSDLPRRGRSQARQILVFAMANAMGDDPDGRLIAVARRGYQALQRYRHRDGGLMFKLAPDGAVLDDHRFAYEQAFLLMAQGWLHKATGEAVYADDAEASWAWLQDTLRNTAHDGFDIAVPGDSNDPRQQNPHMHLFEACLLNAANIGETAWRPRAEWLFGLFERHFFDPREGCLREFFCEDWRLHGRDGDRLDPGHHFEWTWLLGVYGRLTGAVPPQIEALYAYGTRYGLAANGLGVDEILPRGRPLRPTARLWVQCEVLKGHLTMYELTGDPAMLRAADAAMASIARHYLRDDSGCWVDQLSPDLEAVSADSPASTLYHLYVAFCDYRRVTSGRRIAAS